MCELFLTIHCYATNTGRTKVWTMEEEEEEVRRGVKYLIHGLFLVYLLFGKS